MLTNVFPIISQWKRAGYEEGGGTLLSGGESSAKKLKTVAEEK
jgi:hypothetical protein